MRRIAVLCAFMITVPAAVAQESPGEETVRTDNVVVQARYDLT